MEVKAPRVLPVRRVEMKICIFTDSFFPYCSGVTFAVVNQTRELVKRGHEVMIFRPSARKLTAEEQGELPPSVEVVDIPLTLPAAFIKNLKIVVPTFFSSYRKARKFAPDIIHVNTEWGCGWEGLFASRMLGVPLVGTFHTFFAEPGYLKNFLLPNWSVIRWLMWRYATTFYSRCHLITSPSAAVKQALVEKGIKTEPVILSNGINPPELLEDSAVNELKAKHGIEHPALIYVGRIAPEKSMEVLIEAFAAVIAQGVKAQLVIVGDGSSRAAMEKQIDELKIRDHVVSLGFVPHDDLIASNLPRVARAFVTASKTENQPISILEAMSFGLPIIGPHAKGIPELVNHGENGLLFEPDNVEQLAQCMADVLQCDEQQSQLSAGSFATAREHSMEVVVDQLLALYRQTIEAE